MSIRGNKGEWSEIYVLFKIIGDKEIYPGDEELNKIQEIIYPILRILRTESNRNVEYLLDKERDIVIISENNKELIRTKVLDFSNKAQYLLEKIKQHNTGTFNIPKIEKFMNDNSCYSLKANSSSKTDITIVIHDQRTNQTPTLGFSIKSQLGSPSTLLNAGQTTNFKYRVNPPLSKTQIDEINKIDNKQKIKDRIQQISDRGAKLEFEKTQKKIFSNNLILIDSLLPKILAEIVLKFYSSDLSKISDLVQHLEYCNPLKYDTSDNHQFYTYKIGRFLTDIALGMMPSKVWSGEYDATGGYLIVKEDGDILCYHIFEKNQFENYLINNTKLETASSNKHKFGTLYTEEDELFINLNLQIRFIK